MLQKILPLCLFFSSLSCASFEEMCEPRGTLAASHPCDGCSNIFVSTSFLLWQAKLWGLEFASKSYIPNVTGSTDQKFIEKLFVPDFSWEPGVQVLLGGYLPYDGWDFRIGWIHYKEKFTQLKKHFDSLIAPADIGIIPLWQYPFVQVVGGNRADPIRYGFATADWRMNFNTIDLELGRSFFPDEPLPIRLMMGAKIANIQQTYEVKYKQGNATLAIQPGNALPSVFEFISSKFETKTDQWAVGPRIGLESHWNMLSGFNLIGHGAFSVLASSFELKTQYNDVIDPLPSPCVMKMKEHFTELTPVCEAMLGLDWGICFNDQYYFGITLGFEWQYWWAVNHARRNYVQTLPGETFDMRGELQMQGLNGALKFEF